MLRYVMSSLRYATLTIRYVTLRYVSSVNPPSGRRSETAISLLKFVLSYLNFWIMFHSVDDHSIHYGKV